MIKFPFCAATDSKQDRQLISLLFALSFEICQPQRLKLLLTTKIKARNLSTQKNTFLQTKSFNPRQRSPESSCYRNTFWAQRT